MSSNASLQQQQQQQQLLGQRGYPGQQLQNQHPLQGQQVPSPNQSTPQQLLASSWASPYSQSPQVIGSQFGHQLQQQAGVPSRVGAAGGTAQGPMPGLPAMLPVPQSQTFVGLQSQLSSPQQALQAKQKQSPVHSPLYQPGAASSLSVQGQTAMGIMGSGGHSGTGGLAPQIARASTPLNAQQQRMQQQGARQQQLPQSNLTSPTKPHLPRVSSTGSLGSQGQNLGSAQQNSPSRPQTQSWLPTGQIKPLHNQSPSVPYHSQLQQHQQHLLQTSQQRSQQQQSPVSSVGLLPPQQQQQPQQPPQLQQPQPSLEQESPQQQQQQAPPTLLTEPVSVPGSVPPQLPPLQRPQGSASQRPITLSGQPEAVGSRGAKNSGPSRPSGQTDGNGQILGKRSIEDLVSQVDPQEKLDIDVEDILLEIADDFIETVTSFACALAKHRKSPILEAKDVLLHLERNWHMTIPGFGGEDYRAYKKPAVSETHKQRLAVVKKSLALAHPTQEKGLAVPGEKTIPGPQTARAGPATVPLSSPRLHRV